MKKLIILIFLTFPFVSKSQSFPPDSPPRCFEELLKPISPWDWTKERFDGEAIPPSLNFADWWRAYPIFNDGGTPETINMRVPFIYENQVNLLGIYVSGEFQAALAKADYKPEDGWVLVAFDFGFPKGSDPDPAGKINPYLVMYNKYTSVLRVFFYMTQLLDGISANPGNPKAAKITLQYMPNGQANSLPSIFQAADSPVKPVDFLVDIPGGGNEHAFLAMNVFNYAQSTTRVWYFAEFPITYDPCVCEYGSNLRIQLWLNSSSNIDLKIDGRLTSDNLINASGQNNKAKVSDVLSTTINQVGGLVKVSKSFGSSVAELGSAIDKAYPNSQVVADFKALFVGSSTKMVAAKKLAWIPKIGPVIAAGLAMVDFFSGKSKKKEGEVAAIQIKDMKITGNIIGSFVSTYSSGVIDLRVPGSKAMPGSGSLNDPLYDDPLGVAALLRTPKVKISSTANWMNVGIKNRTYIVGRNQYTDWDKASFRYHQIELIEPLEFVVNPKIVDPNKINLNATIIVENILESKDNLIPDFALLTTGYNSISSFFSEASTKGNYNLNKDGLTNSIIPLSNGNIDKVTPSYRTSFYPINQIHKIKAKLTTLKIEGARTIYDIPTWEEDPYYLPTILTYYFEQGFSPRIYIKIVGTIGFLGDVTDEHELSFVAKYPVKIENSVASSSDISVFNVEDYQENILIDNPEDLLNFPIVNGEIKVIATGNITITTNISSNISFTNQAYNNKPIGFYAPDIDVAPEVQLSPNVTLFDEGVTSLLGPPAPLLVSSSAIHTFCTETNGVYNSPSRRYAPRLAFDNLNSLPPIISNTKMGYPIPNPSSGTCEIGFDLAESGSYEMYMSNALGLRVKDLQRSDFAKAGNYTVQFNTENLEAGVYFITLTANGFRQARKLVVVK